MTFFLIHRITHYGQRMKMTGKGENNICPKKYLPIIENYVALNFQIKVVVKNLDRE